MKSGLRILIQASEMPFLVRDDIITKKKRFNSGIARNGGRGLPLPEFFCALFLLKEKVSSMVATAERVGKVARMGGGFEQFGQCPN